MNNDTEATFVRRKFTITEELDAELERMADNNYQGNVSLCLRQAIADHRETLHGNGEVTIRRLVESMAHIEDQVNDLRESVNTVTEEPNPSHNYRSETNVISVLNEGTAESEVGQIITVLGEANTPLRVADIIERVEMQPVDVRHGLGYLVDHGHVFSTGDNPPRYQLATTGLVSNDRNTSGGTNK